MFNSIIYLLYSPSLNVCSPNSSQTKALDALDSSESLENESGIQTRYSVSTSLAMSSELTSPEIPTVNFTPITLKENTNSTSNIANGESMEDTKENTILDLTESVNHHIEQEDSTCNQWFCRNLFYFLNFKFLYFIFN